MRKAAFITIMMFSFALPLPASATTDTVVATHLPLWCMVRNIAGQEWRVDILIRPGTDVHSFALRPGDIRMLRGAAMVIRNGAGLEVHIEKGLRSAGRVVDASEGVEIIRSGDGDPNPHIWLDPVLAIRMVDNIERYLDGSPGVTIRAGRFKDELKALHGETEKMLGPLRGRVLVTYHDSFAYLAKRYGLRAHSLTGPHSESPLPGRMRKLYDMAQRGEVTAVFTEAGYPDSTLKKAARDLGLRVCELSALTTGPMEKGYYIEGMKNNIETISTCLKSEGQR